MGPAPIDRQRAGDRLFHEPGGRDDEWTGLDSIELVERTRGDAGRVRVRRRSFTAFTQNGVGGVGTAGASLSLFTQPVLGYSKTGTQTIDLQLQLDLVGRVLTAGSYSGTLNIRAVTQ